METVKESLITRAKRLQERKLALEAEHEEALRTLALATANVNRIEGELSACKAALRSTAEEYVHDAPQQGPVSLNVLSIDEVVDPNTGQITRRLHYAG